MTSANAPAPRAALLLRLNCDLNYVLGKNKNNKHQQPLVSWLRGGGG